MCYRKGIAALEHWKLFVAVIQWSLTSIAQRAQTKVSTNCGKKNVVLSRQRLQLPAKVTNCARYALNWF